MLYLKLKKQKEGVAMVRLIVKSYWGRYHVVLFTKGNEFYRKTREKTERLNYGEVENYLYFLPITMEKFLNMLQDKDREYIFYRNLEENKNEYSLVRVKKIK
jgi:hypothetical protein